MYKIFLIIFAFKYIKANDKSNEKYIDLLPEEEKQEFLNRIASRILEEVNSPDTPNESQAEVNEEQLDAQNAYVKQIIKEESKMLQNEKRDDVLSNDQETKNRGEKISYIEPHIDLTYRTQSKEDRNESKLNEHLEARKELNVIPVINDQENVKSHDNSAVKSESNTQAINDKDITTELGKNMKKELTTTNDTENFNIIRKSYGDESFLSTTITDFDPDSEENTTATEDEISVTDSTISPDYISSSNTTVTDDDITWISTKKIYDESNENINSESAETTTSSILTTKTDEEQVTTSSVTNLTLESEKSNQEMTTLKIPENSTDFNQSISRNTINKHLYVRSGTSDLKNVSNVTRVTDDLSGLKTNENVTDSVNKVLNVTVSETTTINSIDTKSNTSDSRSIYLVENITELKVKDSHISLRVSNASKESQKDKLEKQHLKPDAKEYEVFEVAADKPPFEMKSNVETKDTPYYIPVYNYAPDNAYYRPRSRFGPNNDSKDKNKSKNYNFFNKNKEVNEEIKKLQVDAPSIRSIFSGYKNKKKQFHGNKPGRYTKKKPKDIFDLPRPIKKINLQNIYYNPKDYLDIDYYYGRTGMQHLRNGDEEVENDEKIFPETDDEDHPYQSIHTSDTVKDHIRAVRKLLYLNQIYEPIPNKKTNELRKFYNKRIQSQKFDVKYNERDKLRNNNLNNIASDYYFSFIPIPRAAQTVIKKTYKNKLLRNLEVKDRMKTKYDQSNELNINSNTTSSNNKLDNMVESMLDVLRDFIRFDNQALSRYNWLESTVDILAAVRKLLELMTQLQFEERIHPKDLELLKYILYLYKSSVNTYEEINKETFLKKGLLPKSKWSNKIIHPLKLWKAVANYIRSSYQERVKVLYDFEDFLQKVLFSLRDFHDAMKHISIITRYNNQKWYEDLKNIYLHDASNDKLLTLLLHVSVTKLLKLIETSATNGAENNFQDYILNNKQHVQRSKEEFLFVLNILHELRRLKINGKGLV